MLNIIRITAIKILKALIVFLIFVYMTVVLCSIPSSFTVKIEEDRLGLSHDLGPIIKEANEKTTST